jgi:branched-chain amino acid transport system substrate-binding protein
MMRATRYLGVLIILLAVLFTACTPAEEIEEKPVVPVEEAEAVGEPLEEAETVGETLKIGTAGPLSGPNALWGVAQKNCAEMWAEELNANGGLLVAGVRHPIEIASCDTQALPEVGKTCAERLVYQDEVVVIMGPNVETVVRPMETTAKPEKVIMMPHSYDPTHVSPDLPYVVNGALMAHHFGPLVYDYFINEYGVEKIAYINKDDTASRKTLMALIEVAEDLGLEVTGYAEYATGTPDMYPHATKVLQGDPDLIDIPLGSAEEVGLVTKALRELGYEGIIVQESGGDAQIISSIAGVENAKDLYFNTGAYDPDNMTPKMAEYAERYVDNYGEWNPDAAQKVYATFVLGAAMQMAGTISDADAIMDALHVIELENPYLVGDHPIRLIGLEEFGINNQVSTPVAFSKIDENGEGTVAFVHFMPPEEGVEYVPYEFEW